MAKQGMNKNDFIMQNLKNLEGQLANQQSNEVDANAYISIGQKGFIQSRLVDGVKTNLFDSYHDIATLVVLSSFNRQDMNGMYLKTFQVTPLMICQRFGFKYESKNLKIVIESLENLKENGVIGVIDLETNKCLEGKITKNTRMMVVQELSKNKIMGTDGDDVRIYSSMLNDYFDIVVNGTKHSDDEKYRLLATYATLATRMNPFDQETNKEASNPFKTFLGAMQAISFESHVNGGAVSKQSRQTFDNYATKLVELGILSRVAVNRTLADNYQISYYYSKRHEQEALRAFVRTNLEQSNLHQLEQYEYLLIRKVWSVEELNGGIKKDVEEKDTTTDEVIEEPKQKQQPKQQSKQQSKPKQPKQKPTLKVISRVDEVEEEYKKVNGYEDFEDNWEKLVVNPDEPEYFFEEEDEEWDKVLMEFIEG
ncbi:hypothetical protein [Globicatella sp. PHS-GS-PNBC-21-1553]|uniref:hypothetical protein n=1 Tax=Globicatella sp. PHS-GS-PNBC-21-1553 TaxID=2885764 RepID=UPI00298F0FBD|nr:hypothetical protein [Globicatella sp. PHS-GS-PNBC-21-1553]WPC08625.1 hypothetical protein LB888_11650 [Globicatella sp. PHS-GS-PNBC-21-1553]